MMSNISGIVSDPRLRVSETGHDDKVQAKTPCENHGPTKNPGSPEGSAMTSTPSTETAQAASSREDNRPPPPPRPNPISTETAPGSQIVTMEPFQSQRNNTKITQKRNKNRRVKQLLLIEQNTRREPNFAKFYIVKFPRLDIETKLNVIATDREIKNKIGIPKKISKLNRDSLLIEVKTNSQGKKLMEMKYITGFEVTVNEHKTMNQCKGTLYSETLSNSTEEELLECLNEQGVIKVERMKRRVYGDLVDTHRYILTFNRTELPPLIRLADWHHEPIDLYIPPPLRCQQCQRLSHTKKWCHRTEITCSRCGTEGHTSRDCQNDPHCVNCNGDHSALDKQCPFYLFKSEVIATQTRQRIPFGDAEAIVKEKFRQENKTYSFKVRSRTNRTQDQEQTNPSSQQSATAPSSSNQIPQYSQIPSFNQIPQFSQIPSSSQIFQFGSSGSLPVTPPSNQTETVTRTPVSPIIQDETPQPPLAKEKPAKETKKTNPKEKSEKTVKRKEEDKKSSMKKVGFSTEKPTRRMSFTSSTDDSSDKDIPKVEKERKYSLTSNITQNIPRTDDIPKLQRGQKRGGDQLSPDLENFKIPRKPPPPPPTESQKISKSQIPVINSRFPPQEKPYSMNHYYNSQ